MRVIDIGGTVSSWRAAPVRPRSLLLVNLEPAVDPSEDWCSVLQGDAAALPTEVLTNGYDLVYSNSVIEHVGGHAARARMARAIRDLAPHHWVQTPYRYFPIEPHWLFPGFQFLPVALRSRISQTWPVGHIRSDAESAVEDVQGVELLSRTEMRAYFPASELYSERFLGMTKSLVAVK
jgi:hypothetical protein